MQRQTISPDFQDRGGWLFLREAIRDLRTTGAIAPSGRRLAAALAEPVRAQTSRPLSVLEVGAGTGPVTRALLPLIGSGSRLDIVESNHRFARRLYRMVQADLDLASLPPLIRVHSTTIERFHTNHRYDVIVSGLPFTNFEPAHVDSILHRYIDLLHPGGTLTYFAYRGSRFARAAFARRAESARHRAVEQILTTHRTLHESARTTVWTNLPPADVWTLRTPAPVHRSTGAFSETSGHTP
ncbi:class I SAM-dependent methyltransferase [Nocardia sp. NPDC052566]|uniref:class I SAM-dependent methyltransferase n=1 Tax=Nocardia sp. NPDC052566 TaxID=3364330 RepID=UPI0037C53DEC